jgi:GT2 family glycosyltransferase
MQDQASPLTSVIMVSYQTGEVLFDAIASVLRQSLPVELCLVDNGNPPEVMARLQALTEKDSRLRLITGQGNVGFSKACNAGARVALGSHLLFLNPDSKLLPDAVERLMQHAGNLVSPFMVGARLLDEQGRDQRGCRRALLTPSTAFIEAFYLGAFFPNARLNFNQEPIPQTISAIPAISGAFMFMPREDFWHIDGFDEGYFLHVEDLDLCLRFTRAGGTIYFAPYIVVTHVGGTSHTTSAFIEKNKALGFSRYFHRNFADYPVVALWLLDLAIWGRTFLKLAVRLVK